MFVTLLDSLKTKKKDTQEKKDTKDTQEKKDTKENKDSICKLNVKSKHHIFDIFWQWKIIGDYIIYYNCDSEYDVYYKNEYIDSYDDIICYGGEILVTQCHDDHICIFRIDYNKDDHNKKIQIVSYCFSINTKNNKILKGNKDFVHRFKYHVLFTKNQKFYLGTDGKVIASKIENNILYWIEQFVSLYDESYFVINKLDMILNEIISTSDKIIINSNEHSISCEIINGYTYFWTHNNFFKEQIYEIYICDDTKLINKIKLCEYTCIIVPDHCFFVSSDSQMINILHEDVFTESKYHVEKYNIISGKCVDRYIFDIKKDKNNKKVKFCENQSRLLVRVDESTVLEFTDEKLDSDTTMKKL